MVEIKGMNAAPVSVNNLNDAFDAVRDAGYRVLETKILFDEKRVILTVGKEAA